MIYIIPVTRINQDQLHSVSQFALDRDMQSFWGSLFEYHQCMPWPWNIILYQAIQRNLAIWQIIPSSGGRHFCLIIKCRKCRKWSLIPPTCLRLTWLSIFGQGPCIRAPISAPEPDVFPLFSLSSLLGVILQCLVINSHSLLNPSAIVFPTQFILYKSLELEENTVYLVFGVLATYNSYTCFYI